MARPSLLATRSAGKLRELRELASLFGMSVIDLGEAGIAPTPDEDHIEVYDTFEENALAKARYFFEKSGLPTLADDSGLVVHALHGEPGVRSKRWSGNTGLEGQALDDANNRKLVATLQELGNDADASAEYVCAAAYKDGDYEVVVRGITSGRMLTTPLGDNGFGYDPYFLSAELHKTFGQASATEKHAISHRGRAFHTLLVRLAADGIVESPTPAGTS